MVYPDQGRTFLVRSGLVGPCWSVMVRSADVPNGMSLR